MPEVAAGPVAETTPFSLGLVLAAGMAALVVVGLGWAATHYAVTIAHEGGHALTASAVGGKVVDIMVAVRGSGETKYELPGGRGDFGVKLAGYLGPSVFGLGGAILLNAGQVRNVLWLSAGFLTCALFMSRNFFTAVRIVATLAVILVVLRYASPSASTFFAYAWIWFLLIGGVRSVSDLARARQSGKDAASDAYRLRGMTHLPAGLWVGFFGLFSFAALILGALILSRSL